MSSTIDNKASWGFFPTEIRQMILKMLLQHGCGLARYNVARVTDSYQAVQLRQRPYDSLNFFDFFLELLTVVGLLWVIYNSV